MATMNFKFNFTGKTVLVTGGTSGIGGAIAKAFKASGASVVACGLTNEEMTAAKGDPTFAGMDLRQLDVTQGDAVVALVASLPTLDVVVNSAGLIRRDAEHEPDAFAHVIDVNLTGGMRMAAAARTKLAASKGSVIFVASVMSFFGGPKQPAYSASKGAIRNLTMSLGAAYAAEGIRVNAVAPGWVTTDLSKGARENPERNAMIMARTPMGRWADVAEIADPVLFLCSDAARYMTGTVMLVDGGYCSVG
jgi:NAD(P)-dependent dehydrogenase (short-subunit alcohol dehydrogenase family)